MKLAVLSGAIRNAGDFLIVKRSKELLQYVYPNCILTEYPRYKDLTDKVDEINKNDCLIIAGGPAYQSNIYPSANFFPKPILSDVKIPIFAMGLGLKAFESHNRFYDFKFAEQTLQLLKYIEQGGLALGCRDFNSIDILRYNGIKNIIMTGCPAWYDLNYINKTVLNTHDDGAEKILVSDPADSKYYAQSLGLILYLRKKIPNREIMVIFHKVKDVGGGAIQDFINALEKENISYTNISGSAEGFNIYDNCALHIGFRAHAHIYMLSHRRPTLLIEEDLRGDGVNAVLGLPSIRINNDNPYLLDFIDSAINYYKVTSYKPFEWAFTRMNYYFQEMISHLKSIQKLT